MAHFLGDLRENNMNAVGLFLSRRDNGVAVWLLYDQCDMLLATTKTELFLLEWNHIFFEFDCSVKRVLLFVLLVTI